MRRECLPGTICSVRARQLRYQTDAWWLAGICTAGGATRARQRLAATELRQEASRPQGRREMRTGQRRWSRAQPWEREGGEDTCGGQSGATRAVPERRRQSTTCVCTSPKQNLQNIPLSTFMLCNTQPPTDSGSTAQAGLQRVYMNCKQGLCWCCRTMLASLSGTGWARICCDLPAGWQP